MRHTKQKICLLAMIICCIAMAAVGTLAYFNDHTTAHNVITSGKIDIELQEWADTEKTIPFADQSDVMPGSVVTKLVEVKNTGDASAWVRAKVSITVTAPVFTVVTSTPTNGNDDGADDATAMLLPDGCVSLDIGSDWTYNESDGYYYYHAALPAGETTTPLFTTVTFDPAMGNIYQNANVVINVNADAVQSANNGTSAQTAAGWPTAE